MSSRLIIWSVLFATGGSATHCGDLTVDHRYQTERQYTLLNFPFDYHKTILLGNGSLAHASALSSRGEGGRAATMVYDVANHAGRLGTWVEEQQIRVKREGSFLIQE